MGDETRPLWEPDEATRESSNVAAYTRFVEGRTGLRFPSYDDLWRWSVEEPDAFWASLWDFYEIKASAPYEQVLEGGERTLPRPTWFPGAQLNYAEHLLRHESRDGPAILFASEDHPVAGLSWNELGVQVRQVRARLRELGVQRGDRVVGYLTNVPETMVAMLATTSLGAIWSMVAPDFGWQGVLERFEQLSPKVLFFVRGYRFGGTAHDRQPHLHQIVAGLPSLVAGIEVQGERGERPAIDGLPVISYEEVTAGAPPGDDGPFEQVPFDHPLWVLFSSGTTGPPKAIIHSHGGVLLEHLKVEGIHMDLRPGDRALWFTTTTWMVWNFLVSMLALGVTPVLYDGDAKYPSPDAMWKLAADARVTFMGTSPGYLELSEKSGVVPGKQFDLAALRTMLPAGSPVSADHGRWLYQNVKQDFWLATSTGGTDVCTAFVGGVPTLPVYAGEIQHRCLGVNVHALGPKGERLVDEVGELVVIAPMPSMPLGFWDDPDGERFIDAYFSTYPGLWRHGDLLRINERGGCYLLGRSDATLNRRGVRIGTGEIYRAVEGMGVVADSLVVHLERPDGSAFMPLFVELEGGAKLTPQLETEIREGLADRYSRRHVPDVIVQVSAIPRTLTGKKMEVPVKNILLGTSLEGAVNTSAMSNPECLTDYVEFAHQHRLVPPV